MLLCNDSSVTRTRGGKINPGRVFVPEGVIIMGKAHDPETFVAEFAATEGDVESGDAKRCTKHGCPCGNVPLMMDAFYRDKSQKTGRASWCKLGEAEYNKPYNKALKEQGALRKRDLAPEQVAEFESVMAPQRKPRVPGVEVQVATTEKVAPKKSAPRKRTPRKKAAATAKA